MLEAIGSLLKNTIDVFLKINSAEARRRKFAKDILGVYKALGDIAVALDGIDRTIVQMTSPSGEYQWRSPGRYPEYIVVRSWSSGGNVTIRSRYLGDDGTEKTSDDRTVSQDELLPLVLGAEIRYFANAVRELARIMKAESWDLFQLQHQPDKLRAIEIYDSGTAETFTKAWFADGGFVEALMGLGLHHEIDGHILKLLDAEFDPLSTTHGYAVKPDEATFDLSSPNDVQAVRERIATCKDSVIAAHDSMKAFIASKIAIEDLL